MSSTLIKAVWPGERTETVKELHNSWGLAPPVWSAMSQHYLGWEKHGFLLAQGDGLQPLWDLGYDASIPRRFRAVLLFTFDRIYVLKEDYPKLAGDIRHFLTIFKELITPGAVNHWPAIAEFLESNPDYPAIGLHCTTVSSNPFQGEYDECKEDYLPFDWNTATDIYSSLEKADNGIKDLPTLPCKE